MSDCICGGTPKRNFNLCSYICVGFGVAQVTKDGVPVYDEMECERAWRTKHPHSKKWPPFWTGARAEREARKDPDHEWIITIYGPLSGAKWKRVSKNTWEIIESNMGFV